VDKPTGDAERLQMFEDALHVDEKISERFSVLHIDDLKSDPEHPSDNDDQLEDSPIAISSDDTKPKARNAKKNPAKSSSTTVLKAYRATANDTGPITGGAPKPRGRTNNSQLAVEAISSIGTFFAPESIRDRQDLKQTQSAQSFHERYIYNEVRRLQMENDRLHREITAETRRADIAENELRMEKALNSLKHRRRSPSSDSSERHYRRRRKYHKPHHLTRSPSPRREWPSSSSHHPSHRRYSSRSPGHSFSEGRDNCDDIYQLPDTVSASRDQDTSPGVLVRVTPKKRQDGTRFYEMSPTQAP
jgi:hypothetical protein